MKISIDFKSLAISLGCFIAVILMISGILQNVIHFKCALNELLFTSFAFTAGSLFLIGSFSKNKNYYSSGV